MTKSCETCMYFKRFNNDFGDCNRYPPMINFDNNLTRYPYVKPSDWCGEYKKGENE